MSSFRLNKEGPEINKILSSFNNWDFNTYPTVQAYIDAALSGYTPSNVVSLTGIQNISGNKTFLDDTLRIKKSGDQNPTGIIGTNNDGTKLQFEFGNGYTGFQCTDRGGDITGDPHAFFEFHAEEDLILYINTWDYPTTKKSYLKFPQKGSVGNWETIATLSDIPSVSDFVTLSTSQTISGDKTFENNSVVIKTTNAVAPSLTFQGTASGYAGSTVINMGTNASNNYTLTLPTNSGVVALTSDIPSVSDFVTMSTNQTISGQKTFSSAIRATAGIALNNNSDPTMVGITLDGAAVKISGNYINLLNTSAVILSNMQTATNTHYSLLLPDTSLFTTDQTIATRETVTTSFGGQTGDITVHPSYFEMSGNELQFKAHLYQHFIYLYNSSDKTHICFGLVSLHPVALTLSEMIDYVRAMLTTTDAKIPATGTIKIGTIDHKYVGAIGKGSNNGELLIYPMQSTGGYDSGQTITASSNLTMIDNCVAIL